MFDFSTKYSFDSSVLPGVRVTIRRLSDMQRAKRDAPIAAQRIRVLEIDELIRQKMQPYVATQTFLFEVPAEAVGEVVEGRRTLTLERAQAVLMRERLPRESDVPSMPLDTVVEIARLNDERMRLNAQFIRPANLRAGLLSIEGPLTYDGQPATADLLLENGPDELILEIDRAVEEHSALSAEQRKNSSSPSDSGEPVASLTAPTTATAA